MASDTEAQHVLLLSSELLDDLELGRLAIDKLILKSSRLARLAGSDEVRKWLTYEMQGYSSSDQTSLAYMGNTGRWTSRDELKGYWGPIGQIEASFLAQQSRLEATKLTSIGGDAAMGVIAQMTRTQQGLSTNLSALAAIKARVTGLLHSFISGVYYERQFADVAASTFEGYKARVDGMIADKAGEVLIKLPSIVARLREGDPEAVSQALTTCRRVIEAFADAIFPPSSETYDMGGGNMLKLDAGKHQNRINAYIAERTHSKSKRDRLRQNIGNLYDRVSTGVHNDVDPEEAYSLFLNVYLFFRRGSDAQAGG